MVTLTRIELDSRAIDFAGDYLGNCGAVGRGLARELTAHDWGAYAYLPRACPEVRRYEFSRGGLHLLGQEDETSVLGEARRLLASDLCERMGADEDTCFVTEIVMARPGDQWLENAGASTSLFADSDVYIHAMSPVSVEALTDEIATAEDLPWSYGVVSVCNGGQRALPARLVASDVEQLVSGARYFYLAAYDLESFVLFDRAT